MSIWSWLVLRVLVHYEPHPPIALIDAASIYARHPDVAAPLELIRIIKEEVSLVRCKTGEVQVKRPPFVIRRVSFHRNSSVWLGRLWWITDMLLI